MRKILVAASLCMAPWAKARAEDKVLLECKGFEHSNTQTVQIVEREDGVPIIREVLRKGDDTERTLTTEEVKKEEYKISPIFGEYERTIKRSKDGWVVSYSCGEDRELSCTENKSDTF